MRRAVHEHASRVVDSPASHRPHCRSLRARPTSAARMARQVPRPMRCQQSCRDSHVACRAISIEDHPGPQIRNVRGFERTSGPHERRKIQQRGVDVVWKERHIWRQREVEAGGLRCEHSQRRVVFDDDADTRFLRKTAVWSSARSGSNSSARRKWARASCGSRRRSRASPSRRWASGPSGASSADLRYWLMASCNWPADRRLSPNSPWNRGLSSPGRSRNASRQARCRPYSASALPNRA